MHKGVFYPKLTDSFPLWDPQMVYKRQMAQRYELSRGISFIDPHDLVPTWNGTQSPRGTYTLGQQQAKWTFSFPNRHGHAMRSELFLGSKLGDHLTREGRLLNYTDNVLVYEGTVRPFLNTWGQAFIIVAITHGTLFWGPPAEIRSFLIPVPW
jgi:hypothetical protein